MTHRYGPTEHVSWLDVDGADTRPPTGKQRWAGKLEQIHIPPVTDEGRMRAARNLILFGATDVAEVLGLTAEVERARWEAVLSYVEGTP